MKVYILMHEFHYEGADVLSVHSTEAGAIEAGNNELLKNNPKTGERFETVDDEPPTSAISNLNIVIEELLD